MVHCIVSFYIIMTRLYNKLTKKQNVMFNKLTKSY
nr:MAG TPA: hypothetical protein [Caudoviricetes sp.]